MPFNENYQGFYAVERDMLVSYKPWDRRRDGDALWRTGIGYICYQQPLLLRGMESCFTVEGNKLQVIRFPYDEIKEAEDYQWARDTASRDQLVMPFIAARWHKKEDMEVYTHLLAWRISKKHRMTIDLRAWLKKEYSTWLLMIILQMLFVIPWNKLWRPIYRRIGYGWAGKLMYPHYSLFITALMLSVVDDDIPAKRFATFLLRLDVEKSNYALMIVLGGPVDTEAMRNYKPTHFRWNRRLDEPTRLYIPENRSVAYNNIDEDFLDACANKFIPIS